VGRRKSVGIVGGRDMEEEKEKCEVVMRL